MSKICVVIVAFRSDETIAHCLKALEAQTCRDFEVIIVDNGETPSLAALAAQTGLALRVIVPGHNLGFAAGNNLAVRNAAADTQWLALLNPDAYARPDWLENFVKAQRRYPAIDMFGSLQLSAARDGECDGLGDCYHIFGVAWRRGHGRLLPSSLRDTECFSPCAAAAFYRYDVFREAGGFDEDYFCYMEDVDLGFRIRLKGGRCMQLAEAGVIHIGGFSSTGAFAISHALRNLVATYIKNMPNPFFWPFLPGMIAAVLTLSFRYALAGHGRAALQGLSGAVLQWRLAWRKRKDIQANRKASAWAVVKVMNWVPLQPLSRLFRPSRRYFAE